MRHQFDLNDESDWLAMCKLLERQLLIRTVVRLSPNLVDEMTRSANEILEAHPESDRTRLAEPIRFTTEQVTNTILADIAASQTQEDTND